MAHPDHDDEHDEHDGDDDAAESDDGDEQPGESPSPAANATTSSATAGAVNVAALHADPRDTFDFTFLVQIRDAWEADLQRAFLNISRTPEWASYDAPTKAQLTNAYAACNRMKLRYCGAKRRADSMARTVDFDAIKARPAEGWYQLTITSPLTDLLPHKAPKATVYWGVAGELDQGTDRRLSDVEGYEKLCADLRAEKEEARTEAKQERIRAQRAERALGLAQGRITELQAEVMIRDARITELESQLKSSDRQLRGVGQGFAGAARKIAHHLGLVDEIEAADFENAVMLQQYLRENPDLQAYIARRKKGQAVIALLAAPVAEEGTEG